MKCEDVLPWLETGGPLNRWRARRHTRGCRRCQAAVRLLGELKQELSAAEPLSGRLRRRWLAAAVTPEDNLRESPPRVSRRALSAAAVIAAVVFLALLPTGLRLLRHSQPVPPPPLAPDKGPELSSVVVRPRERRHVGEIAIVDIDSKEEFVRLEALLAQLQAEMVNLAQGAEQLAVEEQIDRVLEHHRRWLAATQPEDEHVH